MRTEGIGTAAEQVWRTALAVSLATAACSPTGSVNPGAEVEDAASLGPDVTASAAVDATSFANDVSTDTTFSDGASGGPPDPADSQGGEIEASPTDSGQAANPQDSGLAWTGACADCYSVTGCGSDAALGFACPGGCTTAPPIVAGGCTDSILVPWNGQADSSATVLWCCPSDPGGPPPNAGPPDGGLPDAEPIDSGTLDAAASDAGPEACVPLVSCPSGDNCGTVPNGCGGTVSCGSGCLTPETCGGGGAPNVCGCTPACQGNNCGDDGCGGSCGTCSAPQVCGVGLCTKPALEVVAGEYFSCALVDDGTVECWGYNGDGELGTGSTTNSMTPVSVSGLSGVTAITANQDHTCALLLGGTIDCWGADEEGDLGVTYVSTSSDSPVAVSAISGATAIAAGFSHTCAVVAGGVVQCWGENAQGQLGNGTTANSMTPGVAVLGVAGTGAQYLTGVIAIAAGYFHTCALLSGGSVACWGAGAAGELGNGGGSDSSVPLAVSGLTGVTAITAGQNYSCALLSSGTVECWGYNGDGELGSATTGLGGSSTPVPVTGLTGVTSIAAGYDHTCAVLSNGTAACWGASSYGALGNGTANSSTTPVGVSSISSATGIAVGFSHTCAVLSSGAIECWGDNANGGLGNGTQSPCTGDSTPCSLTPVPVSL